MTRPKNGSIAAIEFYPKHPEAEARYMAKAFGWRLSKFNVGGVDIWAWKGGGGPEGRIMAPHGFPSGSTAVFVRVRSVTAVTQRVTKNGGTILVPKFSM